MLHAHFRVCLLSFIEPLSAFSTGRILSVTGNSIGSNVGLAVYLCGSNTRVRIYDGTHKMGLNRLSPAQGKRRLHTIREEEVRGVAAHDVELPEGGT